MVLTSMMLLGRAIKLSDLLTAVCGARPGKYQGVTGKAMLQECFDQKEDWQKSI